MNVTAETASPMTNPPEEDFAQKLGTFYTTTEPKLLDENSIAS